MNIKIGTHTYPLILSDTKAAKQLEQKCPCTMTFERRGSEYFTRMEDPLSQEGLQEESIMEPGTINYFDGWHALSIIFQHTDITPHTVSHLGRIEGDISEQLIHASENIEVTIEK